MAFHTVVIVVLMVFITVVIAVEIAVHTVVTVVWIVFSTAETAVEMAVQMVLKVVWIVVRTVVKNPETAVNTVVATVWMAETVPEKKLLMPFHTVSKKLLMLPHTVCTKQAKEDIQCAFQSIQCCREDGLDSILDAGEDSLCRFLCPAPVALKQIGEHIKQTDQGIQHSAEDGSNILECALKQRCKHLAEAIPDGLQHIGDVL